MDTAKLFQVRFGITERTLFALCILWMSPELRTGETTKESDNFDMDWT